MEQPDGESQTPNDTDPPTASQPTSPIPAPTPTATEQTPVVGPPPVSPPTPGWSQPPLPPPPPFPPSPPGETPPPGPIAPPGSPWNLPASGLATPAAGAIPVWGAAGPPLVTPAPIAPKSPGSWRWVVVAALAGSVVGGSIVAASTHNGTTTVKQISAGPALLNGTTNIESVIAKVLPAVVSIDATAPAPSSQNPFGSGSAGTLEEQGTGMIVTPDGEVVTNNHVIIGATVITVTLYGQTKAMPATLVDTDTANDVALLKIDNASNLPTVSYGNSDNVQVGDAVVAIGNALGLQAGTPTVTQGIISAKGRTVQAGDSTTNAVETLTNMFQTDAAINPGNSGGPLVDSSGKVIGMNTAVAASSNGTSQAQNIGFAIPANKITGLLPALRNKSINNQGSGFLGVGIETLTPQLRSAYNFIPTQGAIVTQVQAGSPASVAGIAQGDVITTFDGKAVTGADQLQQMIQGDRPGQSVKIGLYRGQQQLTVTATLASSNSASSSGGS